ncbi:MAG TPA: nicotinamide riboside transporter PnuC [Bacteroidales bacterium]|nr:nicotinamide riboside transporter PnuC [Bacteroidales bacterium]
MSEILNYIVANWFELTAAALGVIAVFLQIRINSSYWVVSILNVSMYIWVYISQQLYALMILMVYYVAMSVYGFYTWRFGARYKNRNHKVKISYTKLRTWIFTIITVFASFMIIAWALYQFTDSRTPILDGLVTALSFSATWMLARKKIENWLVWLVADIISCYLYYSQKMYPTLVLYAFLSVMAVIGYYSWKNKMKQVNA